MVADVWALINVDWLTAALTLLFSHLSRASIFDVGESSIKKSLNLFTSRRPLSTKPAKFICCPWRKFSFLLEKHNDECVVFAFSLAKYGQRRQFFPFFIQIKYVIIFLAENCYIYYAHVHHFHSTCIHFSPKLEEKQYFNEDAACSMHFLRQNENNGTQWRRYPSRFGVMIAAHVRFHLP